MAKPTSANTAGLHHVSDERTPGIRRVGSSTRVRYVRPNGRPVSAPAELARIKALVIPPAWTDVWICPNPRGHLQATGRDARGRKQYRYHPRFRQMREEAKYARLPAFAQALRRIRRRTAADVRKRGLPRVKVLAAAVQLLEKTLIRIGNEEYARANGSVGLTTMHDRHAKIRGAELRFEFRGKSGVAHVVDLHDARLARIVKACRDLPGHELFQYVDEQGDRQTICSDDVNALPAAHQRRRFHRQGLPHLGRHGAGGAGAGAPRAVQVADRSQAQRRAGDRERRQAAGQHQVGLPEVLHPSRRFSPPTWTAGRWRATKPASPR